MRNILYKFIQIKEILQLKQFFELNYEIQQMSLTPLSSNNYDNHVKIEGLSANDEILIKGIVSLLQNLFYTNISTTTGKNKNEGLKKNNNIHFT